MNKARLASWLVALAVLPGLAVAGAPTGVTAQNAWVRYLLPNLPAGAYLSLTNNSDTPAILTGASSPACSILMLHESMDTSGTAMMMGISTITIPAHGALALSPGGYHLMCMAPKMHIGAQVPLTLEFQDGGTLPLTAQVYGPAGPP